MENYTALEYAQDKKRFIKHHNFTRLYNFETDYNCTREMVENIMKWAKENPPKTNLQHCLGNKEFLDGIAGILFGIDKKTNILYKCSQLNCLDCKFRSKEPCPIKRKKWLESEVEI